MKNPLSHSPGKSSGAAVADPPESVPPRHDEERRESHEREHQREAGIDGPQAKPAPPAAEQTAVGLGTLIDPDAVQGTRFTGPILSGPKGQVAGIVPLIKRFRFTYTQGSFSLPVKLPPSAILLTCYTQIEQSFNGTTPTMKLEVTQGGATYANVDLSVAPTVLTTAVTGLVTSTWTFYLTVTLTAATQGKATVMVMYSVPGKSGV